MGFAFPNDILVLIRSYLHIHLVKAQKTTFTAFDCSIPPMGRRKHCSIPVQQIRVTIDDHTELFCLKRELLRSRAAAIARIMRLREEATRVLREKEDRNNKPCDVPRPSIAHRSEEQDDEQSMAELIWLGSDAP
jgi:hypothetical protein